MITDHHNKYNNNEKVWNIARIFKVWHRDIKWANAAGKMAPIDSPDAGLAQTFHLLKKNKNKQYLWSTIKWNAVIWGMPVLSPGPPAHINLCI